jgi:hypothetical protein
MPQWLAEIPAEFWGVLSEMSPYLLFGFLIAGALSVLVSAEIVERHLGGRGLTPIVKAAAFGVPLPLCSCGVIPVAASLRRHGAGSGPTVSFLVSTPQTGVDSILVTLSLLGPAYAIFRPVAALLSGVFGGLIVSAGGRGEEKAAEQAPGAEACECTACEPLAGGVRGKIRKAFSYGFDALPRDIGRHLLIGLGIAALISAILQPGRLAPYLGSGPLAILAMMAVSVPIYVCATASVPIAAALVVAGVSPGAAFAFLMAGPATNAATIATIWRVLGRRTAVVYVLTVAVSAFVLGLAMNYLFAVGDIDPAMHAHDVLPGWVKTVSAILLLAVLLRAVFWRPKRAAPAAGAAEAGQSGLTLNVEGMTCTHCVQAVRRALMETHGVGSAEVDLDAGTAHVTGTDLDADRLTAAVESVGYKASLAREPEG